MTLPRSKITTGQETVHIRGFVRFICAVHRIETVENTGFVPAPRKSARTVRNRGFVRFIHTVHRGEKTVMYGFPYGEWSRTAEKTCDVEPRRNAPYDLSLIHI